MTRSGGISPHKQATYDRIPDQRLRGGLHFFLKFFDVKSFIIMAVMMTGGIWLRSSGVAPDRFIAFFYTGLGASLLLAGLLFACNFTKAALAARGKA